VKLAILAVGKIKEAWAREGCDEYKKRLARHFPTDEIEVKEAAALAARLPARFRAVALDERGREPTSEELAARLRAWMGSGAPGVAFLIGGADGLPRDLVARADETLALSRLTLPHRLARLLLYEQLYRALSIVRGEPYHRA
jgi:23S rRNA (pseudouridine1915-N3)-methyltransferase